METKPLVYTGGDLKTNAYLIPGESGWICIDAPEGIADAVQTKGLKVAALLLTHGHFDHYWGAAKLIEQHRCPVWCHRADQPMLEDPSLFADYFDPALLPAVRGANDFALPHQGSSALTVAGVPFQLFHIPGHSLGSVTFYRAETKELFGGDVLFRGGVGRWDFPNGSRDGLFRGIRTHLWALPDDVTVYPGHGPQTTIGWERQNNPYLNDPAGR